MMDILLILIIIHLGYATGRMLAWRTDWSIPRFLLLMLTIKYIFLIYGLK
jgi:hypothetical protein